MIRIKTSSIPQFLRSGSFFEGLRIDDEDDFEVPEHCFKCDTYVGSERDLKSLLSTLRFWAIHNVPLDVFQYLVSQGGLEDFEDLTKEFPEFESYLNATLRVKCACPSRTIATAIHERFGLHAVQYLHWNGCELTAEACEAAASVKDLECLVYLHEEKCPWDERTSNAAAAAGNVPCMQYILHFDCPAGLATMECAAREGHVDMLKLLRGAGVLWVQSTMYAALSRDNVECLRYMHSEGWTLSYYLCYYAAIHDSVECLQYLHEEGEQSVVEITIYAAQAGKLRCLVYAHESNGDEWDAKCCEVAARGNHLHCLRYAREHGCPWGEKTLTAAVANGSFDCISYALWHGCPCIINTCVCVITAMFSVAVLLTLLVPLADGLLKASRVVTYAAHPVFILYKVYGDEVTCISQKKLSICVLIFVCVVFPFIVYNLYATRMALSELRKL